MNLPLILKVEPLVTAVSAGVVVTHAVFPPVISIGSRDIMDGTTGEFITPIDVEAATRIIIIHLVCYAINRIATFEGVLLAEEALDVDRVKVDVVAGRLILSDREWIADVRKTRRSLEIGRNGGIGLQ